MFTSNTKQNYAILAFFGLVIISTVSASPAKIVATSIICLLAASLLFVAFRLTKKSLKFISSSKAKSNRRSVNRRVSQASTGRATKKKTGDELMNIPAYARKQMGISFPLQ
ncbi:hypothetical protein [Vibrio pelagius]|uniref:hypothetical protein n=1 Tax=Vibrio pelagius TaxID=28169 RepID=UPI00354BAD33